MWNFGGRTDQFFAGVFDGHGQHGKVAAEFVRDCVTIEFFKAMFTELSVDEGPSPEEILAQTETKVQERADAAAQEQGQKDYQADNFGVSSRSSSLSAGSSRGSVVEKDVSFWEVEPKKRKQVEVDPAIALKVAFEEGQKKLSAAMSTESKFSGTTATGKCST